MNSAVTRCQKTRRELPVRCLYVVLASVALAASAACYVSFREEGQVSLQWNSLEHDFGVVAPGETLKCTFVLHNTSCHATRIESVRPSCGCVAHQVANDTILPGESCDISIDVNTKGFTPPFIVSKHIDVTLEQNGITQLQQLSISADLRPAILIAQSPMLLTTNGPDATATGRLTVQRGTLPRELFLAITPRVPPCYNCSSTQHTTESFVLDVTVPGGDLPAQLPPITLSYPQKAPAVSIDVQVRLAGDPNVVVVPPSVVIATTTSRNAANQSRRETKVVDLESPNGQGLRITDVRMVSDREPGPFTWSVLPDAPYSLVVTLDAPPTDAAVHACRFDIGYELSGTRSRGRAMLRAYAVKTKKPPPSLP